MDLQECHDLLTLAKVGKVKVVLVIVERYGKMYIHGILYMAHCIYAYIYMHGFTGYTLRIHKYTHILTQTGLSTHKQVMHFYNSTVCAVYTVIACGLRRLGGGCSNYDLDAISFLLALPLLQASRSQDMRWADVERVLKRHPRLVAVTSV